MVPWYLRGPPPVGEDRIAAVLTATGCCRKKLKHHVQKVNHRPKWDFYTIAMLNYWRPNALNPRNLEHTRGMIGYN